MPRSIAVLLCLAFSVGLVSPSYAQDKSQDSKTLRLLTFSDYVPAEVKTQFEKETGYKIEVTLSSNDDMVSKLRNATGPVFDLAQPSMDRLATSLPDGKLYRPIDLARVKAEQITPALLAISRKIAGKDGRLYALPHIWGTDGLVVNTKLAKIADYPDLCKAEYKGKTALRLRRVTLLAFAFASGKDPFALYTNPTAYTALMDTVGKTLIACKATARFWDSRDQLLGNMRSDQIVGALAWDTGGWRLNSERADFQYIAPRSGAIGWIDTFALPRRGANEDAAYAWINFNLRPDIAAKVSAATGNLTASAGADELLDPKMRAQVAASFPPAALANIKWYPAMPAELEEVEGRVLERIRSAK